MSWCNVRTGSACAVSCSNSRTEGQGTADLRLAAVSIVAIAMGIENGAA